MILNRLHPECMECMISKQLTAWPEGTPPARQLEYMQRFLRLLAEARPDVGMPAVSNELKKLKQEMFGIEEDFTQIKQHFNALMLARENELQKRLDDAEDPFVQAVRYALVGNYIDFGGALKAVEESELTRMIAQADSFTPDSKAIERLRSDVLRAGRLVYLTDNCGEVVMDKLLMRVMGRMNPGAEIIAMVRGFDVLNDATCEDAQQVGLHEVARVMGNGSGVAGTWLEDVSAEARQTLESADVIIAKGQANFETLRGCGMNVHYLFLCKCDLFAKRFQVPRMTAMLVHDSQS